MSFDLFKFQDEAVDSLRTAIARWTQRVAELGYGPSTVDREPIPLLAHLTAITGAGKTPILAKVIGGIGPSIVLWTTNRSVVIDQTVKKLSVDYRHFLPANTTITGTPTADDWRSVMEDEEGTFILCTTVASWNAPDDAAKGTPDARLTMHRTAPDKTGERPIWDQLGDVDARKRRLWVVYDEGHGQTDVQLDQLLELNPVGLLAASGTPSFSAKTEKLREQLLTSDAWGDIERAAQVEIPTYKVARAGLLKSQIEMNDQNVDPETKIVAAFNQMGDLDSEAADNGFVVSPRAIYIVEESNSKTGGEARPVVIWRVLTERCGVPSSDVAVATTTKELPKDAQKVSDLSQLRAHHRHLIFNKKFSEGWDDPEAYIAYFDGETKSATRIKQNIGRIIRQPNARHFDGVPELNTAYVYLSTEDAKFASIVESIRKHLVEEYGSDENGEANVKVRRSSDRPAAVPIRAGVPDVSLPVLTIAAGDLEPLFNALKAEGERSFGEADRDAVGEIRKRTFKLTDIEQKIATSVVEMGHHIRTGNRDYFLDRVKALSREAFERVPEPILAGPMFEQDSATLSVAQGRISALAREFVEGFEGRVSYVQDPDPQRDTWKPRKLEPSQPASLVFQRSLHDHYPDVPSFLNKDEKEFAEALDRIGEGWWMRNPPSRGMGGYGIPLSAQVAGSQTFCPDFLWWVGELCLALDTTGVHILPPKVRGKLLDLPNPKIALVTRGRVSGALDTVEDPAGWTLVRPGAGGHRRTVHNDLGDLLRTARQA